MKGRKDMDNFADERDQKILEKDKFTFIVLKRIINGENELLLTDHERFILCFSGEDNPVWIWLPDDSSEDEKSRAYEIAKENLLVDGKHTFNLKYDLAEYFIKRAEEDGLKLSVITNMLTYDNPDPVELVFPAEGDVYIPSEEDYPVLADILYRFSHEIDLNKKTKEEFEPDARYMIANDNIYFWKDAEGNITGSCRYKPVGEGLCTVNLVFVYPEYRRRHYAENLVYHVTKTAADAGYLPVLYTNADYVASNECYKKIGYRINGRLCTIGYKKED